MSAGKVRSARMKVYPPPAGVTADEHFHVYLYDVFNEKFLPGHLVPPTVTPVSDLDQALREAGIVVSVMPSQHCRRLFERCNDPVAHQSSWAFAGGTKLRDQRHQVGTRTVSGLGSGPINGANAEHQSGKPPVTAG